MASKPKLKPCPCCGAKAKLTTTRETFEVRGTVMTTWSHQIHCTRCPVQTCGIVGGDSDKLIAAWNRRATDAK